MGADGAATNSNSESYATTEYPGTSRSGIHRDVERLNPDSVLGKVGLILEAFSTDNATLGISELSRNTGIAKATVLRLCRDLSSLGILDRHWSQYRLGLRLFELGSLVQRQRLLRELAMPHLQDLRVSTNETVHLGIPQDGEVFYVARLTGHQSHTAPSRTAGRAPMHCTATGKAMLAHLPDQMLDELLQRPLTPQTRSTIVVGHVLRQDLQNARDLGLAVENEEMMPMFRSIAAPIFGPGKRLLGAVSVTGPTTRVSLESTAGPVRSAGNRISEAVATCWDLV